MLTFASVTAALLLDSVNLLAAESSFSMSDRDRQTGIVVTTDSHENESVQQKLRTRLLVGTVIDKTDGSPLIGANVMVVQTKAGVITDMDGRFSVNIPEKGATIRVSYIGYKTKEVVVTDQGLVSIALDSDSELLSEVVVVGAGTQKKISVTRTTQPTSLNFAPSKRE